MVLSTNGHKLLDIWGNLLESTQKEFVSKAQLLFLTVVSSYKKKYGKVPSLTAFKAYMPMNQNYIDAQVTWGVDDLREFNELLNTVYVPIPATDIDFFTTIAVEIVTSAFEFDMFAAFSQNSVGQVVEFETAKRLSDKRRRFYTQVEEVIDGKKEETRFYIRKGSDVSNLKSQMAYFFKCFPFKIYPNGISTLISGPKASKTLHIIHLMLEAVRSGFHVIAFDLENGINQYEKRLHQALLGLDTYCIESGKMVDGKRLHAADIFDYQEKQVYVEDDLVWVYDHTKEQDESKQDYGFVQAGKWSTDVRIYKARKNINWSLGNVDDSAIYDAKGLIRNEDFPTEYWQDVTAAYKQHILLMDINSVLNEELYKLGAESGGQLVIHYIEKGTPEQMYTAMENFIINKNKESRSWKVDFKQYAHDNGIDLKSGQTTPYLGLISILEDPDYGPQRIAAEIPYEHLVDFATFLQIEEIPSNILELVYALLSALNTSDVFFADSRRRLMVVDWFNLMTPDENVREHYKQFQYIMRGLQSIRKRVEGLSQIVVEGVTNKQDLAVEDYLELEDSSISSSGTKKNDYDVVFRMAMLYSDNHKQKSLRTYKVMLDRYGGGRVGFSFIDNQKQQIQLISEEEFELRMAADAVESDDLQEAVEDFLNP
jgi:hypothetical protein